MILENAGGSVTVDGQRFSPPDRVSVFDDPPSAVYAPPGAEIVVEGALLAGAFTAEASDAPPAYLIEPGDVTTVSRGSGDFAREVRDILPADKPAVRLLAGETINPAGNWSSSPPHKHDVHDPPRQARLEEIYLFRVDPGAGLRAPAQLRDRARARRACLPGRRPRRGDDPVGLSPRGRRPRLPPVLPLVPGRRGTDPALGARSRPRVGGGGLTVPGAGRAWPACSTSTWRSPHWRRRRARRSSSAATGRSCACPSRPASRSRSS